MKIELDVTGYHSQGVTSVFSTSFPFQRTISDAQANEQPLRVSSANGENGEDLQMAEGWTGWVINL